MAAPDPAVLGATVDQLQLEVDRVARELQILAFATFALALIVLLSRHWRGRRP